MSSEKVNSEISSLYSDYYDKNDLAIKREIAARDSVDHIQSLKNGSLGNMIDVGAGNGSVVTEILKRDLAESVTAAEISASGIEKINAISSKKMKSVVQFDGYSLPFSDSEFDTAICIHVLEHVEHERMLIREISRISKEIFIEVPLEGGARGKAYYDTGHINYYTPLSFRAILETSGLEILNEQIITSSKEYEIYLYGKAKGTIRSVIRKLVLKLLRRNAHNAMTYLYAVHCRPASNSVFAKMQG